ncbi:hypothetical protein LQV05_001553 [Cryptococcus neoformans]|nr:hypothetical protein J007_02436 [Cryptococcus neoformans var. grubii]OXC62107.1 hypothetical protein C358_02487 [Cryptococcus neoformans var. grubii MW-RSA852]UOH84741.1 hypothetical protein LQV05_001553 [Cryptococcus neoformans]
MSLNAVKLDQNGKPELLEGSGEIFQTSGHAAKATLLLPGPKKTDTVKGRIWVTDFQIIFYADDQLDFDEDDTVHPLNSLEIPFADLQTLVLSKVLFGPDNLTLTYTPEPDFVIEAMFSIKDKKSMKEVYTAMKQWKEESIRQEKITEAIKELAKEGYAVYNGPKR